MPKDRLTVFMFGYDGWGNATKELHRATAEVERRRGYNPPYWVDVRHNPYTRAAGFHGRRFAEIVDEDNYCAMPDLGNANAGPDATSDRIRIKSPKAVETLLAKIRECRRKGQRCYELAALGADQQARPLRLSQGRARAVADPASRIDELLPHYWRPVVLAH